MGPVPRIISFALERFHRRQPEIGEATRAQIGTPMRPKFRKQIWRALLASIPVAGVLLIADPAMAWEGNARDFVEIRGEGNGWQPYGWVYDPLVRCE
jgi:hypothetical protein